VKCALREKANLAQEFLMGEGGGGCICTGELRLVAVDGSDGAAQDDGEEQTQELDDDDAEAGAQNVRLVVFLPLEQFLCATLKQKYTNLLLFT
jgi:hypothetical protein